MNYLLDKKTRRRKFYYYLSFALLFLVLFYFRSNIFSKFSAASQTVFRPALRLGNKFGSLGEFLRSKDTLITENQNLKLQLEENNAKTTNYDSLLAENQSLKEILGRKSEKVNMVLAAILAKPNQSAYDTLIIDAGMAEGARVGNTVFALGSVPIGRMAEVFTNSSKVVLFSNAGEKTRVLLGSNNFSTEIVGRGGGNFEVVVPNGFTISKGDQAILPGINTYLVGTVIEIISDPRDAAQKALLVSPVNVQELRFVEVEK
jgi:cell shape-determining protein MreC